MKLFSIEQNLRTRTEQGIIDFYKIKMAELGKSVAILTPIGVDSNVHSMYTMGLLKTLKPRKNTILHKIGHFIDHNRNELAREAMEDGYDYLMFVDSDIALNPYTIARMIVRAEDSSSPVQSGIYMQKRPFYRFHAYKLVRGELTEVIIGLEELRDYLGKTTEVDVAGAGCLLIKSSFLLEVPRPWFKTTVDKNNKVVGEDVHFFRTIDQIGVSTTLDGEVVRHCEGQNVYPDDLINGWMYYGRRTKDYHKKQRWMRDERKRFLEGIK